MAKRWIKLWGDSQVAEIHQSEIEAHFLERRRKVSAYTVNQEIKYLKAVFNWGIKKNLVAGNPLNSLEFLPVEARVKYMPPMEDIERILKLAQDDMADYLWLVRDTLARKSEINHLTWDDVNFQERYVTLYTRKKRGGHLTPRAIPMTDKVFTILSTKFGVRDETKPWVFWHTYVSRITHKRMAGPYGDRKTGLEILVQQGWRQALWLARPAPCGSIGNGAGKRLNQLDSEDSWPRKSQNHRDLSS